MKHKNYVDKITVNSAVLPRFAPTHRNPIRFAAKKKKTKQKKKGKEILSKRRVQENGKQKNKKK